MENLRIRELNRNDIVQFQCANKKFSAFQTAIVNQVYGISEGFRVVWEAEVENQAGRTFTITDNDDFIRVKEPFTRKVDMQEEQDMVHEPPHYQFGKFSARMIIELVGKTYKSASVFYHVGNALKYLMRAPRKNGLQDLKKAKQSVEFAIENWED
nr:MAG TPA: nucelotide kinase [Caudoviricetes sp.]